MSPLGVETLIGKIRLGDYDLYSSPIFFLNEKVKHVVISDIDDTIKDSNISQTTGFRQILKSIFRGNYYTYQPVSGMAELYRDLERQGVMIIYLTSTPYQLAPFLLKFLKEGGFPEGPVFPRWLGYRRFGHKWRMLHRILSQLEGQKAYLIGDSGEQDLHIYRRICETPGLSRHVEKILIRHVPGTPVQKTLDSREVYYKNFEILREELFQCLEMSRPKS
jgi:phosphatidate phosphatase APP1